MKQLQAYMGNLGVSRVLELMEVAEEALEVGFPDRKKEPRCLFVACAPPSQLRQTAPIVYRSHVEELVRRAKYTLPKRLARISRECENVDERLENDLLKQLDEPTCAELLLAVSQLSLKAPPSRDYACAYRYLFSQVFGSVEAQRVCGDGLLSPSYPGAIDEVLTEVRNQLRWQTKRPRVGQ